MVLHARVFDLQAKLKFFCVPFFTLEDAVCEKTAIGYHCNHFLVRAQELLAKYVNIVTSAQGGQIPIYDELGPSLKMLKSSSRCEHFSVRR